MERFYSKEENRMIRELSDYQEKVTAFYRLWTMKESYIKARGDGLFNTSLSSLSFVEYQNEHYSIQHSFKGSYFKTFSIQPNYVLSLCTKDSIKSCVIDYPNVESFLRLKNISSIL